MKKTIFYQTEPSSEKFANIENLFTTRWCGAALKTKATEDATDKICKQGAQLYCDIFRQRGVEMNDPTYNKRFSIETPSEEFKPLFLLWFFNL